MVVGVAAVYLGIGALLRTYPVESVELEDDDGGMADEGEWRYCSAPVALIGRADLKVLEEAVSGLPAVVDQLAPPLLGQVELGELHA